MPVTFPDRPPFSLRARLLTPLPDGATRYEPDAVIEVNAEGGLAEVRATSDVPDITGVIDLRPLVLLPGLVDTHVHLPQVPAAGLGAGMDLLAWLERYIFPLERAFRAEAAERLAPQVYRAMAAAGTTTFAGYGAIWPDSLDACFHAAELHGIRAVIGKVMMDRITYDDALPRDAILETSLRQSADLCERWHGAAGGRLRYAFTPRFAVSCSADLLRESAALAEHYGATWQTHLSEDSREMAAVTADFPEAIDYLDVYDRAGGLGRKALFAHAIHLSEREVARLVETDSAVAHCPVSNMFIRSGVMPLAQYRAAGLRVGLGSDVAGAPELSVFTQMREGFYQQSSRSTLQGDDIAAPGPLEWLRLGTLGGAEALGLDDVIGSLEAGKEADLIAVDAEHGAPPEALPADDAEALASRLIFRERAGMVQAAWVRGARLAMPDDPGDLMADFDVLIEHGTVIDGTGSPGFRGAVGIEDDRLTVLRGDTSEHRAAQRIDATDKVIAPGFIDLHSHSGVMIMAEPHHEPKVRQGVTTEVIGVDGNSYAPFASAADLRAFARLNAGLDGLPDIPFDWDSVASYLRRLDGGISVNLAFLVGNSALRIDALGWQDAPADEAALDRMRGLLRESMEAGAFGISSGLDYPPGSYASTDELVALTNEAARLGGFYHTHVRYPLGDRYLDPFREALEIGRRGEGPVHITHLYHRPIYPGPVEELIGLVEEARAGGLDVTWDTYPYEWACTRLVIQLPQWVQSGGPDATLERIADREIRARIRDEMFALGRAYANENPYDNIRLGYFATPAYAPWEGRTIGEFTRATGEDVVDAICDMLIAEDLRPNQVTSGPLTESMAPFLVHPLSMIGSDSTFVGERPSPRTYGSFPRVLGEFVRERRTMPLEVAVRKMTATPAARLGLADRGLLRDGMKADIVVFDPETVRATATYEEPRSYPVGIDWVLVNGEIVVAEGAHTGATPGRALRRGVSE